MGDTWADTSTVHGRLMLAVLGGLAECERELIAACTGEGRERVKARGVKMGHRPKLPLHQQRKAIRRRDKGKPMREIEWILYVTVVTPCQCDLSLQCPDGGPSTQLTSHGPSTVMNRSDPSSGGVHA